MDALETAKATAGPVVHTAAKFMQDPPTYAKGADLGFAGMDFYTVGRGGALGDVDADVVAAAFAFFEPGGLRASWEAGTAVMAPREAAGHFAACCHAWAEAHVPDDVEVKPLADLLGRVVGEASPSGAPLFAAWRRMPEPGTPKALAVHRLNVLRELRGGLHAGAVLAEGVRPLEAVMVNAPFMVGVFGWPEPHPDADPHRDALRRAEEATNRAVAPVFDCLDDAERDDLVAALQALHEAVA